MRKSKPIRLNFGGVEEPGWVDTPQEIIDALCKGSRWQPGTITMGEHKVPGARRRGLGNEYQYKIGDQITNKVDGFIVEEYMEWRDA